jgi:type II secretion system protein H
MDILRVMPIHRTKHFRRGFTLLELVLVMVIACVLLAMIAPSFTNWSRGSQLRDAADNFVAITRYARDRAVTDRAICRLNIDPQAGTYALTMQTDNGDNFAPIQSSWGRHFELDKQMTMQLLGTDGNTPAQQYIDFYPTGRVTPMQLRITDARRETITIECPSPAEGYVVAQNAGGGR